MPESPLRLVKRSAEFISKGEAKLLPRRLRGIYVLYIGFVPLNGSPYGITRSLLKEWVKFLRQCGEFKVWWAP